MHNARIFTFSVSKGWPTATIPMPPKHPAMRSLAINLAFDCFLDMDEVN